MAKRIVTMSISEEVHESAKKLGLNISNTVEKMLSQLVTQKTQDINGINIELKKLEKTELEKTISEKAAQLKRVIIEIDKYEETQRRKKQESLEKERKAIDEKKRCFNCGNSFGVDYKWMRFGVNQVCRSCFMSADQDQLRKWKGRMD